MENRIKHVLLIAGIIAAGLPFGTAHAEDAVQVIEPDLQRRQIERDGIDTENIEVGFFYGVLSIEDFSSSEVYGLRAAYHISEDFFFEAAYGLAEGDLTSYEKLSGGSPLLSDDDREYSYYNLAVGWNALPGEVFVFDDYVFNSSLYFIGGVGSTSFAGDDWFTVNLGAGFRLLLNDSIAWHIDVRDHIFDRDTFGVDETTHNIEFSSGITVFF